MPVAHIASYSPARVRQKTWDPPHLPSNVLARLHKLKQRVQCLQAKLPPSPSGKPRYPSDEKLDPLFCNSRVRGARKSESYRDLLRRRKLQRTAKACARGKPGEGKGEGQLGKLTNECTAVYTRASTYVGQKHVKARGIKSWIVLAVVRGPTLPKRVNTITLESTWTGQSCLESELNALNFKTSRTSTNPFTTGTLSQNIMNVCIQP